jgi:hypothetical protein
MSLSARSLLPVCRSDAAKMIALNRTRNSQKLAKASKMKSRMHPGEMCGVFKEAGQDSFQDPNERLFLHCVVYLIVTSSPSPLISWSGSDHHWHRLVLVSRLKTRFGLVKESVRCRVDRWYARSLT